MRTIHGMLALLTPLMSPLFIRNTKRTAIHIPTEGNYHDLVL